MRGKKKEPGLQWRVSYDNPYGLILTNKYGDPVYPEVYVVTNEAQTDDEILEIMQERKHNYLTIKAKNQEARHRGERLISKEENYSHR